MVPVRARPLLTVLMLGLCHGVLVPAVVPALGPTVALGQEQVSDAALGMRALGDDKQSLLVVPDKQAATPSAFGGPGKDIFWTYVFRRGVTDTAWAPMAQVSGYPLDATLAGDQLALLMNDANWRMVYDGGSSAGEPLPGRGQRLRMLAGEGGKLLAYVTGGDEPRLMRLENSAWVDLGPAPEFAKDVVGDMMVRDGRVVVAGRDAEKRIQVYQSAALPAVAPAPDRRIRRKAPGGAASLPSSQPTANGGVANGGAANGGVANGAATQGASWKPAWESLGATEALKDVVGLRLLPAGKELALWPDPGSKQGGQVYRRDAAGVWTPAFDLGPISGELGMSAGRLRFYYADKEAKKSFERVLDYSGKPLGDATALDLGVQAQKINYLSQMLLGVATAGFMVAIVLSWRRRDKVTPEVLLSAQSLPLASYGKRLLAGTIDNLPWLAALGYLTARGEFTFDVAALKSLDAIIALLLSYATVVTHTTITEVIFGRTLGMTAAGLRVANLEGKRAEPGALVIRNLFRAVDLVLLLPLLSIVFTSLRQSIGDSAAGTVVLSRDSSRMSGPSSGSSDNEKP